MKWCTCCFRQYDDDATFCPYCGSEEVTEPIEPIHMRPGTEIYHGRYVIGPAVGSGGFDIVYRS